MPARKKATKKTAAKKKAAKKTAKKTAKKAAARKKAAAKPAGKTPARKKATTGAGKKAAKKTVRKVAKKKTAAKKTAKAPARKKPAARKSADRTVVSQSGVRYTPYKAKRGEEYMNPDQVRHFREILLAWKRGLMEEVDRTVNHMQDDASNFPDPNDRATQEEEFALELRTRDRERKLIKKIDESLASIEAEEYGYCEECGVEIGIERLEARPTATQCIDCKTLDEIREKQMG